MDEKKIKRINELYHKSKGEGLTQEELAEQKALREGIWPLSAQTSGEPLTIFPLWKRMAALPRCQNRIKGK